ncbi:hypothetical protein ACVIKO_003038 [Rhizobium ruizarguesonis]
MAGFQSLQYMGADVIFDGGFGGGAPLNQMFFLNTKYLFYRPHRDRDMAPIGDERMNTNQDAFVQLNSATASTWSNAKLGLVDRVKTRYGAGIHVIGVTIIPTMTPSSDSGRTVAGYTVPALWTTTLATVNNTIKASSRYAKVIDQLLAFTTDIDPTKSPAAEMFPLGNVVGHPGNQDGVTTWDTIKLPASVPDGTRIMFEYQPGQWTSRNTYGRVDNGDGTADYKVQEIFATNVQDNAALLAHGMNLDVSSYVHPTLQGILRFVSRLPQSEKLKFYP